MELANKKKERMNYMSYMIVVKTKQNIIIASDSYSTYPNKELKDANYKKIHCIKDNELYIAMNGLNTVIKNGELVDINTTFMDFFQDINNSNVHQAVKDYAEFLKSSCDKFFMDIRFYVIYKKTMYRVDVVHNQPVFIEFLNENDEDFQTSGEDEYLMYGLLHLKRDDLNLGGKELLEKCIGSVKDVIHLDAIRNPEGRRIVGGKVQWLVL